MDHAAFGNMQFAARMHQRKKHINPPERGYCSLHFRSFIQALTGSFSTPPVICRHRSVGEESPQLIAWHEILAEN